MEKRKVYRRRFIIIIGLIISVLILIALIPIKKVEYEYKTYNVGAGETIYSIATGLDFTAYGTKNIMEVIFLIRQDNSISPDLTIGQQIKIREEI